MAVRFLTSRGRGDGVVQPNSWVEHGQGDHGLGQEDALGHEPEHIVPGNGASQTAPGGGGAVHAAGEHADAGERKNGQEGLGPGREREGGRVAAAVLVGRGVVIVAAVGLTGPKVGNGQTYQGGGEPKRLEEEASEEDGLAGGGLGGETETPVAHGHGAGEGQAQADALEEGSEEIRPDEEAEVGVGREGRVFWA